MIYVDTVENGYLYYDQWGSYGVGNQDIITNSDSVFTQSHLIKSSYPDKGIKILSSYLGLPENISLYELYSYYFEGKVKTDFDMLEVLFNAFLKESDYCFCVKVGVSFCWFTLINGVVMKLGVLQFSDIETKYTVGRFIKRLSYSVAKSGINLSKLKYLVWSEDDISYEFRCYITDFTCLSDFFGTIQGLRKHTLREVVDILSKNLNQGTGGLTAEVFVDSLSDSSKALRLSHSNGVLMSRSTFYKDYSSCTSPYTGGKGCTYGLIIDCEGILGGTGDIKDGCRELGGLIYMRYKNVLVNIDTFSCTSVLLEDTLLQVIRNYKEFSGVFTKSMNVLCYGSSDSQMLQASVQSICSQRTVKIIRQMFKFVDTRHYISEYIQNTDIVIDKRKTLSNIALAVGVKPIYPKHKSLNDAKTLFNILSRILINTGRFCV